MPQQQPASGLMSMAPIANEGCAYGQTLDRYRDYGGVHESC